MQNYAVGYMRFSAPRTTLLKEDRYLSFLTVRNSSWHSHSRIHSNAETRIVAIRSASLLEQEKRSTLLPGADVILSIPPLTALHFLLVRASQIEKMHHRPISSICSTSLWSREESLTSWLNARLTYSLACSSTYNSTTILLGDLMAQ